ncbi:MAG TPA: hypothetical protein VNC22_00040 [Sporichthya sp.]|nr:hypothetical protein [Sporichthya sp.]
MSPRSAFAGLAAAALLAGLTGCGNDDASAAEAPLSSFDVVVVASATNDPLHADLYGIRFDPLSAVQITHGKNVSTVDATASRVVVAAADGDVDQLAFVGADGGLSEIPGMGRPFAYNPTFVDSHTLMFDDVLVPKENVQVNRTVQWDETAQAKKVLFETADDLIGSTPGPAGQVAAIRTGKNGRKSVVVRAASGETREVPIDGDIGRLDWGPHYIAVALNRAQVESGGDPSIATILVDPVAGKQLQLGASQPIAWTPDGTKLLVRQTGDAKNSQLAFFDPAKPDDLQRLGGITGLVIYSGAWVKGDPF